jgi:ketosteroid isomerase-like protein
MKRLLILAAAACALIGGASVVRADGDAAAKKEIQAQYDKMDAALAKKDVGAYVKVCTPDFVNVDEKGSKSSLSELKVQMKQVLDAAKTFKSTSAITKIKLSVVHVKQQVAASLLPPGATQVQNLKIAAESDDTWVKSSAGWKVSKSVTISQKADIK